MRAGMGSVYCKRIWNKVRMAGMGNSRMGKEKAVMLECWNGVMRTRTEQLWVLQNHKPMGNLLLYPSFSLGLVSILPLERHHLTHLEDVSWAGGILLLFPYADWAKVKRKIRVFSLFGII
uniref:Uncharacterized protein n=1 Tax=Picea glauca TaxID=3330 RepID=A0A101M2A6_PICGL|nr:hypothetical protein ABT39_MTgene2828 [Picea glauca]QHR87639.1 hypothetical protein Q903MT_gene1651 [Picea sitchensis]